MSVETFMHWVVEPSLLLACFIIVVTSIILSFRTRFVQFRTLPILVKQLCHALYQREEGQNNVCSTVSSHKALFTAMSTTIGMSTIVSPVIAMHFGGPGALVGFLFTTLFGSALTFTEVTYALLYRKRQANGTFLGGPMPYLEKAFSPFIAKSYAFCCLILMGMWSAANANQLAAILDSSLLQGYGIPRPWTGLIVTCSVLLLLFGGIRAIGNFSAKLVPIMFFFFIGAGCWIVLSHIGKLPAVLAMIWQSAFSTEALTSGIATGGLFSALRWGIFKGMQCNEAGVGTQTMPHSMAENKDPVAQGVLAMASIYSSGFVVCLSGLVALLTDTWRDPLLEVGIAMLAQSFQQSFSSAGIGLIVLSTFLFAFGSILGNSFNASQCFAYLSKGKYIAVYYVIIGSMILWGALAGVSTVWSLCDICLALVSIPHVLALLKLSSSEPHLLQARQEST
jgi:AGCS family alanine or glycine:cation symporter